MLVTWPSLYAGEASLDPVRCAEVLSRRVAQGKAFVGTVEPARRSVLGTAVAGRVDVVFVEPGDLIDQGGKIVQLRERSIRIRVQSAKADVEIARQQLAELVAGSRSEELQRLDARAKAAKAVHVFATKKFERLAELSERGATAQGDLDQALSAKIAAEQNHLAAQAAHEEALAGTRKEQLAQAAARVTKAEEELNRIQDELHEHTVTAPFRGFVVKRLAEKGEWLQVGAPIAEVIELDPAEVRIAVPEQFISQIQRDQRVQVDVAATRTPGKSNQLISGSVFRIIPDADSRSRSFPVHIRINNPVSNGLPLLNPGMLARVYLPVGEAAKVLVVPQDALVLDRNRAFVFVVESKAKNLNTVRRIEVQVGTIQDSLIQVAAVKTNQLSVGDFVVTEGNERLDSGQAVAVIQE